MTDNDDAKTIPEDTHFPSFASLKTAHSELLEAEPEDDKDTKYYGAVEEFFNRARQTGELLSDDEERRSAQSILNYWLTVLYRADRKPQYTTLAQLNADLRPNLKDAECPYPGPREFTEEEHKYFYGRYRQIEYMLARFKLESFLVMLGPSGGGKSSLVQAGLIPALRRLDPEDEPDGNRMYFFPLMTPGKNPLKNLAIALKEAKLGPEADAQKHYEKLRAAPGYLADIIREHVKTPVVLVVDQFEEIFTLCHDQQLREAFAASLMGLNDGRNKIILCVIDDDYNDELNKLPALKDHFKRASTVLPKLGLSELTDAIVKPAEIVGLKFKEQTVKDIVQEIAGEPVGLPLMQFTLLKLWEKRVGEETPDEFSMRMGSCRQILSQSAESLFKGFHNAQQDAARKVLSRFIKVDKSGTHTRIVPRSELEEIEGGSKVVDAMEKEHLVRLTKSARPSDVQVEIVHESLLTEWPVMKQLVREKEHRRNSYRVARNVLLSVLLISLGIVAYRWNMSREERERRGLERAAASKWAAESGKELAGRRIDLALMLALAAYKADDNLNTRGALLDVLHYSPRPKAFFNPDPIMTGDVALSADGQRLAANDADGLIAVWDLSHVRQEPFMRIRNEAASELKGEITPLAFSPDGRLLAAGAISQSGEERVAAVTLWDVASGNKVATLKALKAKKAQEAEEGEEGEEEINCITFDRDGQRLAAGDKTGDIFLWNTADGSAPLVLSKHEGWVNDLRFSPDGNLLASGSNDGTVVTWDVKSGRPQRELKYDCNCLKKTVGGNPKQVTGLVFNKPGNRLFVGSTEDVVLYDVANGELKATFSSDQNGVGMFLSLSEDDKILQGIDSQGGFYLWDVGNNTRFKVPKKLFRPLAAAWSITFSRDGNMMALSGENGISAWDLARQRPLSVPVSEDSNGLAFSPDSRTLASVDNDGQVILWDVASHKMRRALFNEGRGAYGVAFNHTGDLLAVASATGSVVLWKVSDEQDTGTFFEVPEDMNDPGESLAIAFTPEDKTIVTLSSTYVDDETKFYLSTWSVEQRRRIGDPKNLLVAKDQELTRVAFSSDGRVLALATQGEDGSDITLWNTISGAPIDYMPRILTGRVESLALSADSMWIAAGQDKESRIVIWNRQTQKVEAVPGEVQPGKISHLAFSADSKTLSASIEQSAGNGRGESVMDEINVVALWDISSLRVSSQIGTALTKSQSGSDLILNRLGSPFSGHEYSTTALALSPDSKLLAVADYGESLMIWDIDVKGAKAIICGIANREFTSEESERYKAAIELTKPCHQTFQTFWGEAGSH